MWNTVESLTRKDLQELQLERYNELLQRVWQSVPFYIDSLRHLHPERNKLRSLDQVSELPLTTKMDLRSHYPDKLFAVSPSLIRRYHASSGTRGKPTLVAYTQKDLDVWAELGARSLYAAGARPGDLIHNSYMYGPFTGGLGVHAAIDRLEATCVPASGGKTQQQITLLRDLQAQVLCCTPSYALRLADTLAEMNLSRAKLALRVGIFGAEPWSEAMRARIENELGLKARDIYGLSEIMGPGVSIECEQSGSGLHIWEDHFYPEIIDPTTLAPLADGQEGELVISTLTKEALPLIRYRTGDMSRLTREKCACGRTMARMDRVRARVDDMLIIRGVNVYPSEIENILLRMGELSPHYQLILKRERSLDELAVQVELQEDLGTTSIESECGESSTHQLSQRIQQQLKETLGLTVSVELLPSRSIARSEGKASRLLDLRETTDR
jgi:phenylacetate-CoA ligase